MVLAVVFFSSLRTGVGACVYIDLLNCDPESTYTYTLATLFSLRSRICSTNIA